MKLIVCLWSGETPTSERGGAVVHEVERAGYRWHQPDEGGYPHRIAVEAPTPRDVAIVWEMVWSMDAVQSVWVEP